VPHARCEVVLSADLPAAPAATAPPPVSPFAHGLDEVYRTLLFHGPHLHAVSNVVGCGEQGVIAALRPGPAPSAWITQPLRSRWLSDPLAVDGAFQAFILWLQERRSVPGLPVHVAAYRQYRRQYPADGVRAVVRIKRTTELHTLGDIELLDTEGRLVARLDGCEFATDPGLVRAYRRNRVPAAATS
jgi:hypothetical protein